MEDSLKLAVQVVARAAVIPAPAPAGGESSGSARPLRIVHIIGALGPGGAEQQLTYLASSTRRSGQSVHVLSANPLEGDDAHNKPALLAAGVSCASIRLHPWGQRTPPSAMPEELARLFEGHIDRETLIPLAIELLRDRPDVVHCWMDTSNALGGLAALVAGVSRIVLSTRSVGPQHVPRLDRPYFRETYRQLASSDRVRLLANSYVGAADYAEWLGIDVDRFTVVHNGLDGASLTPATRAQREQVRRSLGFDPQAFLVVGIFRLAEEKAPLDFLRVVAQARSLVPSLRVVHVGVGPMAAEVRRGARELGLDGVLTFLGRIEDTERVLAAADVSILTSRHEGCPNVALESQALRVPVVLPRTGGAPETLEDGETGFLVDVGDIEGFVGRLQELAEDADLRGRFGLAGRERVLESFSLERMIEHTTRLYRGD